jgi:predicted Zn-dependent protease
MDRQALLRFGDARMALRPFDRLLRAEPREAYPYSHRAEVYLWLGRYARAEKDFRRALALNDYLLWPKIGLAAAALLRGNPARAVERLEHASGRGGSDSILSNWWGEALRRLGRPREALARLARIPEKLPYRPAVWLNAALCRLDLDQPAEARRLYRALRRAIPEFLAEAERGASHGRVPRTEAELRRALEKALALMRGNRSSWFYSYHQRGRPRVMRLRVADREKAPPMLRGYSWAFMSERGS